MKWSLNTNSRLALASLGVVAATTAASRAPAPHEAAASQFMCNANCYDPCNGGQCAYRCQFNIINVSCTPHEDASFYYCDSGTC